MSRVLFILKRREDFNAKIHSHVGLSTGLYNSAKFMDDMLEEHGLTPSLTRQNQQEYAEENARQAELYKHFRMPKSEEDDIEDIEETKV
jgi:hypothetical protein